jgi:hypothetical protein
MIPFGIIGVGFVLAMLGVFSLYVAVRFLLNPWLMDDRALGWLIMAVLAFGFIGLLLK